MLRLSLLLLTLGASVSQAVQALNAPEYVAHAGARIDGRNYTNSLEALDVAYQRGFRFFELDFSWTTDDELVLIHDWHGTWQHLFGGEEQPTLVQFLNQPMRGGYTALTAKSALAWFAEHDDAYLITDIKARNLTGLRVLADSPAQDQVIPQVFSLEEYRAAMAMGFPRAVLSTYRGEWTPQAVIDFAREHEVWGVGAPIEQVIDGDFDALLGTETTPHLFTYTVNSAEDWRLLQELGVDGIYTDVLFEKPLYVIESD